jgi:hypothetical protein
MLHICLRLLNGRFSRPEGCHLVVQVAPYLEVWDLAVLSGAVRPESDLSSEAVRLAAPVLAVVFLVSIGTSGRDGAAQTSLESVVCTWPSLDQEH